MKLRTCVWECKKSRVSAISRLPIVRDKIEKKKNVQQIEKEEQRKKEFVGKLVTIFPTDFCCFLKKKKLDDYDIFASKCKKLGIFYFSAFYAKCRRGDDRDVQKTK